MVVEHEPCGKPRRGCSARHRPPDQRWCGSLSNRHRFKLIKNNNNQHERKILDSKSENI